MDVHSRGTNLPLVVMWLSHFMPFVVTMVTTSSGEFSSEDISDMSSDEDGPDEARFDCERSKTRSNTISHKNFMHKPVGLSNQCALAIMSLTAMEKFNGSPPDEVNELLDEITSEVVQVVRKTVTHMRSHDREQIHNLLRERMEERANGEQRGMPCWNYDATNPLSSKSTFQAVVMDGHWV